MSYPPQGIITPGRFNAHTADLDAHTKNIMEEQRVGGWFYGLPGQVSGALTLVANKLYGRPFFVPRTITIDRIGIRVVTGEAATNAKLAIYNSNASLQPSSLLLDAGIVSLATAEAVSIEINQQLTKAWYFFALLANSTTAAVVLISNPSWTPIGMSHLGGGASSTYYDTRAYADGFPDPWANPTIGSYHTLAIGYRLASLD